MADFTLPRDCGGITMERDGTRYYPDSTGHIQVDNPAHAAQIAANGKRYIHKRIVGTYSDDSGRCPCGFLPYSFSPECPRCGRSRQED